jgi:hypothetical protein
VKTLQASGQYPVKMAGVYDKPTNSLLNTTTTSNAFCGSIVSQAALLTDDWVTDPTCKWDDNLLLEERTDGLICFMNDSH